MRLLPFLIASVALHSLFFSSGPAKLTIPTLAISLEPRSIDLQIRTRIKRKEVSPLPKEEAKVAPPKPEKPIVSPKAEPPPLPPREKEVEQPPVPIETKPQEYVSAVNEKPRLAERAEYLSNPPPEYPEQARRRRQEGTVTLLVNIDSNGRVKALDIQKSSGFTLLDKAAEKAVAKWRFTPATIGDRRVPSKVIVPVLFKLKR